MADTFGVMRAPTNALTIGTSNGVSYVCPADGTTTVHEPHIAELEAKGWKLSHRIEIDCGALIRAADVMRWRSTLAKFMNKTLGGNLDLLMLSDSTPIEDSTSVPLNIQGINGMASQMARGLRQKGYNASADHLLGTQGTAGPADLMSKDVRYGYNLATPPVWGSQPAIGGADRILNVGAWETWTSTIPVTKIELEWRDAAVGRNFSYAVKSGNGAFGAETQVNSTGVAQFGRTVIDAGAADIKTVRLTGVLGNPSIYKIVMYDDTGGKLSINVLPGNIRGATSAALINNQGAPNGGRIAQLWAKPPHLILDEGGAVNDWNAVGGAAVSVAQSKSNMHSQYNLFSTVAPVFFLTPPFSNNTAGNAGNQDAYVTAQIEVAKLVRTAVIDWRKRLKSFAEAAAGGLMAEDVHPPGTGQFDWSDYALEELGF